MTDNAPDNYDAAIGHVMEARREYADACRDHGYESWPAEQAQERLNRAIDHRDAMRVEHDATHR